MIFKKNKGKEDMVSISIKRTTYMKLYLLSEEKNKRFDELIEELF